GRARLRELAREPDDSPPPLMPESERSRLSAYVDRFNARDFDGVREMLAEDVQLEIVTRTRLRGRKEAATYFGNYATRDDWRFVPGFVDRQPALLVCERPGQPAYFVVLKWAGDQVSGIRDFRHARYALESAEVSILP